MKTLIIIFAGAIALTGCMTTGHYRGEDGRDDGSSSAYSDKPDESHPYTGKKDKPSDPYVRDLPKDAETALAKVGIKDMAFFAAVDSDGRVRLLKPSNVEYEEAKRPIFIKELLGVKPIAILTYRGSHCVMWSDGWMDWMGPRPDGLKDSGEVHTSGGMLGSGKVFCMRRK